MLPHDERSPFEQNPWKLFRNDSGETVPPFSILRIKSVESFNGAIRYVIGKPNTTRYGLYLVSGPIAVPSTKDGICTTLTQSGYVAYESSDGTPALGEAWGAKNGQWTAAKSVPGFFICGGTKLTAGVNVVVAASIPPQRQKLVRYTHLPAALGGSGTFGATSSATNRTIYPKLWQEAYDLSTGGEMLDASTPGYVANLGDLPLKDGWAICSKMFNDSTYSYGGDIWGVVQVLSPAAYGAGIYELTPSTTGDWDLEDGEAILFRGNNTNANGSTQNWNFDWGGDVMLSHPGFYEVTFGYSGKVYANPPYYDHTTSAQSAGTAHTHTYQLPTGFRVYMGIHKNFRPTVTTIGGNSDPTLQMENYHFSKNPASGIDPVFSFEKTAYVTHDALPWHGQWHTRLSLYGKVTMDARTSSGTSTFRFDRVWLSVRPSQRCAGSLSQGIGGGVNQYPGGYSAGSGTFVWYGSGSQPIYIDKDGAQI